MGASRTRVQGRREVIVGRRAGHDMSKKQWLVLLHVAALHMIANISRDGLTGSRDADWETRYMRTGEVDEKEQTYF